MRLGFAALLLVGACAAPGAGSPEVLLSEFRIDPERLTLQPGRTAVRVVNDGQFGHTLVVSGADGRVVAATSVLDAGEAVELAVDLEPGRYQLTCRIVMQIPDGTVVDHYEEGMRARVDVDG